ncbi:hypothetical protein PsorP6_016866 [Peronosclerospora sorghi]|uniref:Uncharacterized protein n=1 Tax=Peronosclerospora sorghi TaxID=230839 RepID=A0ACC0WD13_9STRA|nr:hypothetical protein PsorP6_016866 [Peronosclerospora sorghi]
MATLETTVQSLHKFATPLYGTQFDMGVTLGTGSFGRFRFATHKATNTVWAIKILKKAEIIRLQQEKSILLCMNHPFIVNLAGTYQDTKCLYMVLEYVIGGEFCTHLRKARRFSNNTAKFYAAQIVLIFEYMHKQDFIYRDLKPENLLLDSRGYIKITDFSFAKRVAFKTFTLCGTPEHIAPEVLLNKGNGKGVDWWTLGILLYEMLAGQPPFCDDDPVGIYQQILSGKLNFPRFFDSNAKWVEDIKKHKFFADVVWEDLLGRKSIAPIIRRVGNANDTSNIDPYPDSMEDAIVPVYDGEDPFAEF